VLVELLDKLDTELSELVLLSDWLLTLDDDSELLELELALDWLESAISLANHFLIGRCRRFAAATIWAAFALNLAGAATVLAFFSHRFMSKKRTPRRVEPGHGVRTPSRRT
jgi:hypothetical protein